MYGRRGRGGNVNILGALLKCNNLNSEAIQDQVLSAFTRAFLALQLVTESDGRKSSFLSIFLIDVHL